MRPPESSEAAIEFSLERGKAVTVAQSEFDFAIRNVLFTGDFENGLVDIQRQNRSCDDGDALRPISGATGDFQNVSSAEIITHKLFKRAEVGLPFRFLINGLVLRRSLRIVRDHIHARS